ncbi:hypothetical protein ACFSMW_00500, partial [Virgibacillus halophilus]|uniref:hypothetical protein n=1 Tax=Tigheibacillus halophilus TaxID=361280 RepID=UPI003640F974
ILMDRGLNYSLHVGYLLFSFQGTKFKFTLDFLSKTIIIYIVALKDHLVETKYSFHSTVAQW